MEKNSMNILFRYNFNYDLSSVPNHEMKLQSPIYLEDYWEVAVKHISIEKTWKTIPFDQSFYLVHYDKEKLFKLDKNEICIIKKGFYTKKSLVGKINSLVKEFATKIDDKYVLKSNHDIGISHTPYLFPNENGKIYLAPGVLNNETELCYLLFDHYLGDVLGLTYMGIEDRIVRTFNTYNEILKKKPLQKIGNYYKTAWDYYDDNVIKEIIVTSDICKESVYNDSLIPLISIINVPADIKFKDYITKTFENPFYTPVKKNIFNSIKFEFLENVKLKYNLINTPFTLGQITIILHLRKCQNQLKFIDVPLEPLPDGIDDDSQIKPEINPLSIIDRHSSNAKNKPKITPPTNKSVNLPQKTPIIKPSIASSGTSASVITPKPIENHETSVKNPKLPTSVDILLKKSKSLDSIDTLTKISKPSVPLDTTVIKPKIMIENSKSLESVDTSTKISNPLVYPDKTVIKQKILESVKPLDNIDDTITTSKSNTNEPTKDVKVDTSKISNNEDAVEEDDDEHPFKSRESIKRPDYKLLDDTELIQIPGYKNLPNN